jgi:hypothetical protein
MTLISNHKRKREESCVELRRISSRSINMHDVDEKVESAFN